MNRSTVATVLCLLSSLAAVSCDDSDLCPAAYVVSSFSIAFERPEWSATDYAIELSYRNAAGKVSHACSIRVPVLAVTDAGTDDGGVDLGLAVDFENALNDAGSEEDAAFIQCSSSPRDAAPLRAVIGRVILISVSETPEEVHLVVRDPDEIVLEQDLEPKYENTHPLGPECGTTKSARLHVTLP